MTTKDHLIEFNRFEYYLKQKKIPYKRYDNALLHQIAVPDVGEHYVFDVCCINGTHEYDLGLLNATGLPVVLDSDDGFAKYLTAETLKNRIEKWEKIHGKLRDSVVSVHKNKQSTGSV